MMFEIIRKQKWKRALEMLRISKGRHGEGEKVNHGDGGREGLKRFSMEAKQRARRPLF